MGIVGYSRIGEQVARISSAFGMKVLAHKRNMSVNTPLANFQWVEQDELFERSDVISMHCPLTVETEKMINADRLNRMKRSAFLLTSDRRFRLPGGFPL
ncbi:D-isomer specific 2-hydroxyacid dehydrogenase, NAD binding domain [Paenibacillus sp. yr247]|nr:D-isomer specific 2-hydroxyacid dehydrogenase, NAD binding domain [Paenibacillus sp. yr247]